MPTNHELLGRGLKLYTDAMRGFVQARLLGFYGKNWWEFGVVDSLAPLPRGNVLRAVEKDPERELIDHLDATHFERIIQKSHSNAFKAVLPDLTQVKGHLAAAGAARVKWAHPESGDAGTDEVSNWLYSMAQALERAGLPEAAKLEAVRAELISGGQPPKPEPAPASVPAPSSGLPYWWQVCEPQPAFRNPASIDEGLFAATLGAVHAGSARDEYQKPEIFFEHTYFTENLKQIIRDMLSRMAGGDGASATELQTPFGGGKTHALLALYHLIKTPEASLAVPGVREALGEIDVPAGAKVIAFDGQEWGTEPVLKETGDSVYTLWGELAWQTDREVFRKLIAATDDKGTAPGNATFREVLKAASPCLILIDELISYLVKLRFSSQKRTQNLYRQTVQFVQELLQEAGNTAGVCVVLSLPKSRHEFGGLDANELQMQLDILPELQARADRVVARRTPVNDDEIYTLMSKRLFKTVDRDAARRVADGYRRVYQAHGALYDDLVLTSDYYEQQVASWPLHPELIDVLYKKWSTVSDFPRTRAVLQLLANVVASEWQAKRPAHAIHSGHVDLERERIRSRIAGAMGAGTGWDAVIAADIIGGDAHADHEDDKRGGDYERHHVFRGVATSLLMHSFGGNVQKGALPSDLYLSIVSPELGPQYVQEALAVIDNRFHYVHPQGNLRRFETKINVIRRITDAAREQPEALVAERLRETLSKAAGTASGFRVLTWAASDNTLPDQPEPTIAILDPKHRLSSENRGDASDLRAIPQLWERSGGGLRQWRNSVVLIAPDSDLWTQTEATTRDVLAHKQVIDDADRGRIELSEGEKRDLRSRLKDRDDSLRTAVVSSYRWVLYPNKDGGLSALGLPETATKEDTIAARAVARLANQDFGHPKVLTSLGAAYFDARIAPQAWKDRANDALDLAALRRQFRQWTWMPILPDIDAALRRMVREGIAQERWAVAIGDDAQLAYTQLIDTPAALDSLSNLTDGTAWLVAGDKLGLIRDLLRPAIPDPEPEPEPGPDPSPDPYPDPEPGPGPVPIPKPQRHTHVRLNVAEMGISKTSNLQPYLFRHLQGQDPSALVSVTIDVRSDTGIADEVIHKTIVEGLEMLGIRVEPETD